MSAIWKQSRKIPPTKQAKAVSFRRVSLLAFLLRWQMSGGTKMLAVLPATSGGHELSLQG
jgi:hypothetical protein